jgi:magnesium-transporting ATPase (P-type)
VTALITPGREDVVTVYIKGAPEVILEMCRYELTGINPAEIDYDSRK